MQERLIEFFQRSVNARSQMAQTSSPTLVSASQVIVRALLEDGRVLVWAESEAIPLARLMSSQLLRNGEFERPPLPAICLNDAGLPAADGADSAAAAVDLSLRALRALGSPGDVLVLLVPARDPENLRDLIIAAHEKGIAVILCHNGSHALDDSLLQERDLALALPDDSLAIILDSLLFATQALCALVDHQLFGSRI